MTSEFEVHVGSIAHGGHCVARVEGRVVFVRHAIPGERVRIAIREGGESDRYWRADVVEVLEPSVYRVPSVWPEAGPGGIGGGEFAHIALDEQRRLKGEVITEQLRHLANIDREVPVESLPGDDEGGGLHYRTRIQLVADEHGKPGMFGYRDHEVIALNPDAPSGPMPLALPEVEAAIPFDRVLAPGTKMSIVASARGVHVLEENHDDPIIEETVTVGTRTWTLQHRASGFWQVHHRAPDVLASAVREAVGDVSGRHVLDLYSGAGLFSVVLADDVGPSGSITSIESDAASVESGQGNTSWAPWVTHRRDRVDRGLHRLPTPADVAVLDPPRKGAGKTVMKELSEHAVSRIVYVSCDPATLARDIGYAQRLGYSLNDLRAFDLFPHTHHVEMVATLGTLPT